MMSVIQAKRKESTMQFVTNMRELLEATIRRCLRLPKRMTFFVGQKLCEDTTALYKKIIRVRDMYDKDYIPQRIELCKECISELNYISSVIGMIKNICDSPNMDSNLKDKAYLSWANEIEEEIKLLRGLIKKDKER